LARKDGPSLFEAFKNMPKKDPTGATKPDAGGPEKPGGPVYAAAPKSISLGQRVDVVIEASKAALVVLALILILVFGIFYVLGVIHGRSQTDQSEPVAAAGGISVDGIQVVPRHPDAVETGAPSIKPPESEGKPPVITKPVIAVEEPGPKEKLWSIQVRMAEHTPSGEELFKDRVQTLIDQGFDAFYVKKTIRNKLWMIIYVGRFESSTSEDLKKVLKKVRTVRYGTTKYSDAYPQKLSTEDLKNVYR